MICFTAKFHIFWLSNPWNRIRPQLIQEAEKFNNLPHVSDWGLDYLEYVNINPFHLVGQSLWKHFSLQVSPQKMFKLPTTFFKLFEFDLTTQPLKKKVSQNRSLKVLDSNFNNLTGFDFVLIFRVLTKKISVPMYLFGSGIITKWKPVLI